MSFTSSSYIVLLFQQPQHRLFRHAEHGVASEGRLEAAWSKAVMPGTKVQPKTRTKVHSILDR